LQRAGAYRSRVEDLELQIVVATGRTAGVGKAALIGEDGGLRQDHTGQAQGGQQSRCQGLALIS
jgi:hypothetical protein